MTREKKMISKSFGTFSMLIKSNPRFADSLGNKIRDNTNDIGKINVKKSASDNRRHNKKFFLESALVSYLVVSCGRVYEYHVLMFNLLIPL